MKIFCMVHFMMSMLCSEISFFLLFWTISIRNTLCEFSYTDVQQCLHVSHIYIYDPLFLDKSKVFLRKRAISCHYFRNLC